MNTLTAVISVLIILFFLYAFLFLRKKKKVSTGPFPASYRSILEEQVSFYRQLDDENKIEFENRLQHFLAQVRITGVKTQEEDLDKVLIAASAVIPIFNFPGWEYVNLHEVLLYPGAFDDDYRLEGSHRSLVGMVGSGPLNHIMIISRSALRQAFLIKRERTIQLFMSLCTWWIKLTVRLTGFRNLSWKENISCPGSA